MTDCAPVSARAAALQPSATLAVSGKAKRLKAAGKDVISFAAGEPDFRTPEHICEAAIRAIRDGRHGYPPTPGTPGLREAVCEKFARDNDLAYTPDQVLVSPGAKYSLYLAVQSLVDPGDEVLVPTPAWVSYVPMVALAGGKAVPVPTREEDAFTLDAQAVAGAVTDRTKLLLLNSPTNPTGAVIDPPAVRALAEVLEAKGLWCVSDEIYEMLVYDGAEHLSVAAVSDYAREHTVVVNGASKCYAMTGWRIGYAAGPKEVAQAMGRIQSQSTSGACAIAQAAAEAALRGPQACVADMVRAFDERRRVIVQGLNALEGVECVSPRGAFYAFPNVSALLGADLKGGRVDNDIAFCEQAIDQALIAPVPGTPFGAPGYVRMSYATDRAQIEEGLARLKDFVTG